NFAFLMGLLESEYFAAAAVHAGAIQPQNRTYIGYAKRKIPLSIFVGDSDQLFPLAVIKKTKEALNKEGIEPEVNIIKSHDHDYYGVAAKINRFAWDFLKARELTVAPHYEQYQLKN